MTSQEIISHIEKLEAEVIGSREWHKARHLVIEYLQRYHGLTDQFQWAYKVIELLKELEELRKLKG